MHYINFGQQHRRLYCDCLEEKPMNENKYYTGVDWMRLIAAVLVITIHTSPLAGFNATGDFILTRIIARIAFRSF